MSLWREISDLKLPRCRVNDRELDRRLHDAVMHLADETPSLAAAVLEVWKRAFPLHCSLCEELPHDGRPCPRSTK